MNKVIRDGQVAVIYSPGYGAGWSTWAQEDDLSQLFDPQLVHLIEQAVQDEILAYCSLRWPDQYQGGARDLAVAWVPLGDHFRIHEYDGSERVEIQSQIRNWIQA